ncbi:MAG: fimbrial biogenesis outer membrane usher protein, partial [Amphiplicatus sp.]|nr:fimbrial biogenesis outer membrane usher protein [Amphiplicatus sp.]
MRHPSDVLGVPPPDDAGDGGLLLVQPVLNGRRLDASLFVMKRGDDILLSVQGIEEVGIAPPSVVEEVRGVEFVSISEYPSMRVEIDERRAELRIRCGADCFSSSAVSVRESEAPELSAVSTGAFINYDIFAQVGEPSTQFGAFVEAGIFSSAGTVLSSMACSNGRTNGDCVRLESNWTIDDPQSLRRLQIGDTISHADGWGAPIRYGGVRWGTDFSLRPDFITFPTPSLKGDASLPGVAEVFINDAQRFETGLPAGPFSISDLPMVTGAGSASVVVTDLLGRQTVITADYYAAPQMLKRGLSTYSLEAGFQREDYGVRSNAYGDAFAAAGYGVGVTDWMTTRLRAEISESQQAAGASLAIASSTFGLFEVSGAVSNTDGRHGERIDVSHEWRSAKYSVGGKVTYTTEDFRQLGQESPSPKLSIRSFASVSLSEFGSASANWIYSEQRDGEDFSAAGLRYSVSLGRASLNLSALQTFEPKDNTTVSFYIFVPFGEGGASASAGLDYDGRRYGGDLRFRKSAPQEGGFGYRA